MTYTINQLNSIKSYVKLLKNNGYDDKKIIRTNPKFILNYYKEIEKFINESDYAFNTKKSYLNNLGVILRDHLKASKKIYEPIIKSAVEYNNIQQENEKILEDQGIESDKCFISFETITNKLKELETNYKQNKTIKNMNLYLMIALNVYQPPLRKTLSDMVIITDIKNDNKEDNFLYIKSASDMRYIINKDKVSNKKDEKDKTISLNTRAIEAINNSLKIYPRKYLLTQFNDINKPLSSQSYAVHLKGLFPGEKCVMTQNVLRRAYTTNLISQLPSRKEKERIARAMRSSSNMLDGVYNQLVQSREIKPVKIDSDKLKPIKIKKEKITEPIIENNKPKFDLKKWRKDYYEENKNKIKEKDKKRYDKDSYNILRKKIIRNLNNGNVNAPKPETIEKYNLKKQGNKWV